jgi:hypothetical protein
VRHLRSFKRELRQNRDEKPSTAAKKRRPPRCRIAGWQSGGVRPRPGPVARPNPRLRFASHPLKLVA